MSISNKFGVVFYLVLLMLVVNASSILDGHYQQPDPEPDEFDWAGVGQDNCSEDLITFDECENVCVGECFKVPAEGCEGHTEYYCNTFHDDGDDIDYDCANMDEYGNYNSYCFVECIHTTCWLSPDHILYQYCFSPETPSDGCVLVEDDITVPDEHSHTYYVYCPETFHNACGTDPDLDEQGQGTESNLFVQNFEYSPAALRTPIFRSIPINAFVGLLNQRGVQYEVTVGQILGRIETETDDRLTGDYVLPCTIRNCPASVGESPLSGYFPSVRLYDISCLYLNLNYEDGKLISNRVEIIGTFPLYLCETRQARINPYDYMCKHDQSNSGGCIPSSDHLFSRSYHGVSADIGRNSHVKTTLDHICQLAGFERSVGFDSEYYSGSRSFDGFGSKKRATFFYYDGISWKITRQKRHNYLPNTDSLECYSACFNHTQARKFSLEAVEAYNQRLNT